MSWRHMHVTSHLAGDPGLGAFLEAAHQLNGFELVMNVTMNDRVIAVVFYSKDLDDCEDELYTLPQAVEALSGLLEHDIVIASAWASFEAYGSARPRQCIWEIPGRQAVIQAPAQALAGYRDRVTKEDE